MITAIAGGLFMYNNASAQTGILHGTTQTVN